MTDKVLPVATHTPQSVLERVTADLAISVGDLALCHAVDGEKELVQKLAGIAQCAIHAAQELSQMADAGEFERIAAEADRDAAQASRRVS
jgi:hypothetical protein